MTRVQPTDDVLRDLAARYENGESLWAIGRSCGRDHKTIGRWLRQAGVTLRPRVAVTAHRREERRRKAKARRAARVDFVMRYSGRRTVAWMAQRLGLSERTVQNLIWTEGAAPTLRDDLLTTGHVADLLDVSQQSVSAWCRRGILTAWRNPGGRYWLVPCEEVARVLRRQGRRADDPRLTDPPSWPRVILHRGHARRVRGCGAPAPPS